ncbi:MAG: DUF2612 domain-containing protein [Phaeodactylibacter sp.]|nr:DUF2612 domain-containing protein [Phaeodactylibacter sp.]
MSFAGIDKLPSIRAEDILIGQYVDSVNLKEYIGVFTSELDEMHTAGLSNLSGRTLDNAVGAQLDAIGTLVGQVRGSYDEVFGTFFGFDGVIGGGSFGTSGDTGIGDFFRSPSDTTFKTVPWDDFTYRKFIRTRIIKNTKPITINVIIEILILVLDNVTTAEVVTDTPAHFTITLTETLSETDKLLLQSGLDLIPKPVGVDYTINHPC